MWIAKTRPDIVNAVQEVAKQAHHPAARHWKTAPKSVAVFLESFEVWEYGFPEGKREMVAHVDATRASCKGDRRPVFGAIIEFAGVAVLWLSWSQKSNSS